jgi:hypothetical protein
MVGADDPAANQHYMGVQFSTNLSHTTWHFLVKGGGAVGRTNTSQTVVAGTPVFLRIASNAGASAMFMELLSAQGASLSSLSNRLPGSRRDY